MNKKWALMDGDDIIYEDDLKVKVYEYAWRMGYTKANYQIIALPKADTSMIV